MDSVYLITFESGGSAEKFSRRVLEVADFQDAVQALITLGANDAKKVEVFKASLIR